MIITIFNRLFLKKTTCFLSIFLFFCINITIAQKNDFHNIVGIWTSESTSVKLTFQISKSNKLNLTIVDTTSGNRLKIKKFIITGDTVYTKEMFRSTHWITYNKYYLASKDSLVNEITNKELTVIYFKRK